MIFFGVFFIMVVNFSAKAAALIEGIDSRESVVFSVRNGVSGCFAQLQYLTKGGKDYQEAIHQIQVSLLTEEDNKIQTIMEEVQVLEDERANIEKSHGDAHSFDDDVLDWLYQKEVPDNALKDSRLENIRIRIENCKERAYVVSTACACQREFLIRAARENISDVKHLLDSLLVMSYEDLEKSGFISTNA